MASLVMTIGLIALAQLCVISIHANQVARRTTVATVLAWQKLEQLQSLMFKFDDAGARLSDTTTDTTVVPERSTSGTGLSPSPAGALVQDTPGYCDFLDAGGRLLGGSVGAAPAATAYVRRWSIEPLPSADALLMQVSVTPRGMRTSSSDVRRRHIEETRFVVIKARKSG